MKTLLKKYFWYDEFRPLQEDIISSVMDKKDAFVLMPTWGWKSLCYQLPALAFKWLTVVISPLIALMKDQVDALTANGIPAELINSSLTMNEIESVKERVLNGEVKILYLSPERINADTFQEFLHTLKENNLIDLIAIDEAHCISEWGHDFRPDYRKMKGLKEKFNTIPIIALTATATDKVREDIIGNLWLQTPQRFISSFDRPNLTLTVERKKWAQKRLLQLLEDYKEESVIVYCFSRKDTEKLSELLNQEWFSSLPYHAGLNNKTRIANQEAFIKDEVQIIIATIAFWMGIDKPDIRLIVHYSAPKTLEGYYQEIWRAWRDNLPSRCVLFYTYADIRKYSQFIGKMKSLKEQKAAKDKAEKVVRYCEHTSCRRKYLLKYFLEDYKWEWCWSCDMCFGWKEMYDATLITQKILSAVIKTGSRFWMKYISEVLRWSSAKRILDNWHDSLSVHWIVDDYSEDELLFIIQSLIDNEYIIKADSEYPTLSVSSKWIIFLKSNENISLIKPPVIEKKEKKEKKWKKKKQSQEVLDYNKDLFKELRTLRKELADEREVPPYVIFSDRALHEMAYYLPSNKPDFAKINWVWEKKLEILGDTFLEVIWKFVASNNGL